MLTSHFVPGVVPWEFSARDLADSILRPSFIVAAAVLLIESVGEILCPRFRGNVVHVCQLGTRIVT